LAIVEPRTPSAAGLLGVKVWLRATWLIGRGSCLYLIPDYKTEQEAEAILEEVYEAILEAELDFWHRDTGTCVRQENWRTKSG
jgi:hypothetical protein